MLAKIRARQAEQPGDTQRVELLGRNRLIDKLLRGDLEVAPPERDCGIDLIAYDDRISAMAAYVARPIQVKAAWTRSFVIDQRSAKFPDYYQPTSGTWATASELSRMH